MKLKVLTSDPRKIEPQEPELTLWLKDKGAVAILAAIHSSVPEECRHLLWIDSTGRLTINKAAFNDLGLDVNIKN